MCGQTINYKGNEIPKGVIGTQGGTWTQTSWIEHPWIFRDAETGQVLLHYIPDRIIPSTVFDVSTDLDQVDPHDTTTKTGVHRFTIQDRLDADGNEFLISLYDQILPFPANKHLTSPEQAVFWTIRHMLRGVAACSQNTVTDWTIILKYFNNILQHPAHFKYRKIRIANATFFNQIWNTPARGLFLAAGFVERGAHVELGTSQPLSHNRTTELSNFVVLLEQWKIEWPELVNSNHPIQQPDGIDGSGRAGFGVAGSNAFRQN